MNRFYEELDKEASQAEEDFERGFISLEELNSVHRELSRVEYEYDQGDMDWYFENGY